MVIFALKSSRMYKKTLKDLEGSWMFYKFLEGYFVKVNIGMKILFSERACSKTAKKTSLLNKACEFEEFFHRPRKSIFLRIFIKTQRKVLIT